MTLQVVLFFLLLVTWYVLPVVDSSAGGISDRVIAFVDDQAITLSEFEGQYSHAIRVSPDSTREEVLDTMINRILLLREAKRYRIDAATQDEAVREYIDLKMRAFVRVNEGDIERFYHEHTAEFPGKDYEDVREEIELYLTEKELNERLKGILKALREKAYIKSFLYGEQGR